MSYLTIPEAADAVCRTGRTLYERGYVASNDGNISIRVGDDALLITPAGISKGELRPELLILCALDGTVLPREGIDAAALGVRPSSETKMHLRVYRENSSARAVVHAHPIAATSFAIAGIPLDRPIYPQVFAVIGTKGVPCTPYAEPGTNEVPDSIAPYAADDSGYTALLLGNHGALSWGETVGQALFRMETLESYAQLTLNTVYTIGRANEIPAAH